MNPPWLALGELQRSTLQRRAQQPPTTPRWPIGLGSEVVGSVAPLLWDRLVAQGCTPQTLGLQPGGGPSGPCWRLEGDATGSLARLGQALRHAGLVRRWHDEAVPVVDAQGRCLGAVERGLTRLLGLPVHAVHLVGTVPEPGHGRSPGVFDLGHTGVTTWVQQRALNKDQDPGLWDTLVGGTVAYGESPTETLTRELWEEAGLRLDQLQDLQACGQVRVARPERGDDGLTYWIDHIHCYRAALAADTAPVNQDGEVLRFQRLNAPHLAQWLQQDRFTLEAACALLQALARPEHPPD